MRSTLMAVVVLGALGVTARAAEDRVCPADFDGGGRAQSLMAAIQASPAPEKGHGAALGESAAAPATWPQLIEKARQHGQFTPGEDETPANFTLYDVRGGTSAPHLADYMSLWGYGVPSNFYPSQATLVSEDWTIPQDGNWHIDQWIMWLDLEGKLTRAQHNQLVETLQREVLEDNTQGLAVDDPQAVAKLAALRDLWDAFKPQN